MSHRCLPVLVITTHKIGKFVYAEDISIQKKGGKKPTTSCNLVPGVCQIWMSPSSLPLPDCFPPEFYLLELKCAWQGCVFTFLCLFYCCQKGCFSNWCDGWFHQHEHAVNDSPHSLFSSAVVFSLLTASLFSNPRYSSPDKKGKHSLKEDLEQDFILLYVLLFRRADDDDDDFSVALVSLFIHPLIWFYSFVNFLFFYFYSIVLIVPVFMQQNVFYSFM